MPLILSTGTNLGDRLGNINKAQILLSKKLRLIASSHVYQSPAVDYLDQPDFLNQVLQFETPLNMNPMEVLEFILSTEKKMGRIREIPKGPRIIDIDILFWNCEILNLPNLEIPHPRLFVRSFIVLPLFELPYAATLKKNFNFPDQFENSAEIFQPTQS